MSRGWGKDGHRRAARTKCGYSLIPLSAHAPCTKTAGHAGSHNSRCILPVFTASREPIKFVKR